MDLLDPHYKLSPWAYYREWFRPWKLSTFALGMGWLFYGALFYGIGDWDIGVSVLMGVLAYLLAPWSVLVIGSALRYKPRRWPWHIALAIGASIFVADGSYMLYHTLMSNPIYREANFPASLSLYFLCGAIWLFRGSFKDFCLELRKNFWFS